MSLGDHLGAHKHSRRGLLEALQDLHVGARAGDGVGVQPEDRQRRHRLLEQGGQALRPGTVAGEGHRAACRAEAGDGLAVAAVMAQQALGALVEDE